jgi:hypothetical protein
MAPQIINVFLSEYPGVKLPSNLRVPSSSTIGDVCNDIMGRFPPGLDGKVQILAGKKQLQPHSEAPFTSLLDSPDDALISLHFWVPFCGGKGGFGSQLRAAGGKMSSRKRRQQGEQNGSSRNLDGRRLRTVTEAKALAEYLAIKPEMDKREKEERRKRWQAIVDMAEKKTEEMKDGSKTRLDSKYFETLEETTEKTRMAVLSALEQGQIKSFLGTEASNKAESDESAEASEEESDTDEIPAAGPSDAKQTASAPQAKKFFGWDDEDMSEDDEEEEKQKGETASRSVGNGKGKAKA